MNIKVKNINGKMENNLEGAKVELVINALESLKDVIAICYGENPYPSSDFGDEEMEKLYYEANEYVLKFIARGERDFDK